MKLAWAINVCPHKLTIPVLCVVPPVIHVNLQGARNEELQLLSVKPLQQGDWYHLVGSGIRIHHHYQTLAAG